MRWEQRMDWWGKLWEYWSAAKRAVTSETLLVFLSGYLLNKKNYKLKSSKKTIKVKNALTLVSGRSERV
jgi:hypothetical protein